jgi:hypothetical protein
MAKQQLSPNKQSSSQQKQKLLKKSEKLREGCLVETKAFIGAEQAARRNAAEIYLWWKEASELNGFLDKLFEGKRKLRDVDYGYNYRYVIQNFYGTKIDDGDIDRKGRVLNVLDDEYKKNTKLYVKDGVTGLVNFIGKEGGLRGLYERTYKPNQVKPAASQATARATSQSSLPYSDELYKQPLIVHARRIIQSKIADDLRIAKLSDEAFEFFNSHNSIQTVTANTDIATDKANYSVLLVNGDDRTYELLEAATEVADIKKTIVSAYRNQFAALPPSLRCLYETIATQTVTKNVVKHEGALETNSASATKNHEGKKLKAKRRLIYRKGTEDFLLSPYDATDGVVTIAKPKHEVFQKPQTDLFMPVLNRKVVEQRLLIPRDFNSFKASNEKHIPRSAYSNVFSHLIRIDNKCNPSDFIFHDFWPFYEHESNPHASFPSQLDYDVAHDKTCTLKTAIDALSIKAVANKLALPWLSNAGSQIKRDYQKLWQVTIDATSFSIAFHNVGDKFNQAAHINFAKPLKGKCKYSGIFLAQDIAPVLCSLANLDATSIELLGSEHALVLGFSTDAANYKICIPTSTTKLKRSTKAFTQYTATVIPLALSSFDGIDDVTDAHIDAFVQQDAPDDYDEILAGYDDYDDEWALNFVATEGAP